MIERYVHEQLYNALQDFASQHNVNVYRARQILGNISFPALLIDYGDAVLDRRNIPINEIYEINIADDIFYKRGVAVQQSILLNLYDDDLIRIAELQVELFKFCKQLQLDLIHLGTFTYRGVNEEDDPDKGYDIGTYLSKLGKTTFEVLPPRILDFVEEDFIYRRVIEIVCKFVIDYDEIVKTIEEVEAEVEMHE